MNEINLCEDKYLTCCIKIVNSLIIKRGFAATNISETCLDFPHFELGNFQLYKTVLSVRFKQNLQLFKILRHLERHYNLNRMTILQDL